jgi:hypothetical protein
LTISLHGNLFSFAVEFYAVDFKTPTNVAITVGNLPWSVIFNNVLKIKKSKGEGEEHLLTA